MNELSNIDIKKFIDTFENLARIERHNQTVMGIKKSEARVLLAVEYLHNKQNCKVNISTISKSLSITPLSTTEFVRSLARKITFFAILLGIGLPFQNWFRVNVLFSMERSYLPWTISMMVCGAVFMTIFYGFIKDKLAKKEEEEVVELTEVTE